MKHPNFNIYINVKKISIFDRSFLFGDGVFETILIKNNEPIFLNDHFDRMKNGCIKLGYQIPDMNLFNQVIKKCVQKTNDCVVKIIITRGESSFGYQIPKNIKTNMYALKIPIEQNKNLPLSLGVSKYNLIKNEFLSNIKHNNRLEQSLIALQLTKKIKYSDLLVLDENDYVIETLSSNIFFIKN